MQLHKRLVSGLLTIVIVAAPFLLWSQRQNIFDWWRLRNYTPSADIERLATNTSMSDYGRKLFYVYHPELDDKQTFNTRCRDSESSIVLGCYVSQTGIYIFNVDDPRLQGIKEVTAAHEMLHAAYDRLSVSERTQLDGRLLAFFETLEDARLTKTVEAYRKKDPNVVPNELHSILGTEVRTLTPELESYYKRYFDNRQAVVKYSEDYEQAFTDIQNKVEQYDKDLESLRANINDSQASLESQLTRLNNERGRLNALAASNRTEEYNAGVPGYNAMVQRYNTTVVSVQNMIDRFNRMVAERNALVAEENNLVKAIDSRPSTIQTQ